MICLVTERHRLANGDNTADRLVELVAAAASAGVELIQIRERDLDASNLTALVRRCVEAVRGTKSRVLVNDRVDIALAAAAHGVHLRSDSIDALTARRVLRPGALVGRSVHSAEEAGLVSQRGGLDYLILGTLFHTPSKPQAHRLVPLNELSVACRISSLPILAIGGITLDRASAVARAGAAGIAAIGLFVPPAADSPHDHVETVVAALRRAFDTCGAVP